MLVSGLIIPFSGKNSDIPSGWERDDRFNERLAKHSPIGNGQFMGSKTHAHEDSHTHQFPSHTHSTTLEKCGQTGSMQHQDAPPREFCSTHAHSANSSGACNVMTTSASDEGFMLGNSTPLSYEVIYIRSLGHNLIPPNGLVYRQDKETNLLLFPAAHNKFLIGAPAGADAGGITGTNNHTHDTNHAHAADHSHGDSNSGPASSGAIGGFGHSGGDTARWNHTHLVHYHKTTLTSSAWFGTTSSSETNEPPYKQLNLFIADKHTPVSVGDIVMTTGDVPRGWQLLDTQEVYFKVTANDILGSGGTITHTHEDLVHTHGGISHAHSGGHDQQSGGMNDVWGNTTGNHQNFASSGHWHALTISANTLTISSTSTKCQNAQQIPLTISVKYIKATNQALGGSANIYHHFL